MNYVGLEGLILKKVVVKDNDLIITVLLRSGAKVSIYCYGGQSSRKGKSALLEIGMMNKYEVSSKKKDGSVFVLKEVQNIWQYKSIRHDFKLFSALCFILELLSDVTLPYHHEDEQYIKSEAEDLFKITSNAIFFLEKEAAKEQCSVLSVMFLFMIQLMQQQGVFPSLEDCVLTGDKLYPDARVCLHPREGGFCLLDALSIKGETQRREDDDMLWGLLKTHQLGSFKQLQPIENLSFSHFHQLVHFFCYQINKELDSLNSLKLLK